MIVVTADHGRAFRANEHSRKLTENNAYVLHVPLFIKLPGQKEGRVSDILVSNIDIVPTIADILGIKTSWKFDGESVFSKSRRDDAKIEVATEGKTFIFDRNELVRMPLLRWHSEKFPSNTPLSDLVVSNSYSHLVGRHVENLEIADDASGEAPYLKANLSSFADIDRKRGYLPALLQSEIGGSIPPSSRWVAIAMNDRIVAVAPVYTAENGSKHIASLLPESAFRQGRNTVSAFFIEGSAVRPRLSPITTNSETFIMSSEGSVERLQSSTGEIYVIAKDTKFGHVDKVVVRDLTLTLVGWSADTQVMKPTQTVVAFVNNKFACATSPSIKRPDVADHFQSALLGLSGFSVTCPLEGSALPQGSLRVFSISPTGTVGELRAAGY